jgi:hypothetical protein
VVAAKEEKMHSVIHQLNPALSRTCRSPAAQEFYTVQLKKLQVDVTCTQHNLKHFFFVFVCQMVFSL